MSQAMQNELNALRARVEALEASLEGKAENAVAAFKAEFAALTERLESAVQRIEAKGKGFFK